MSILATCLDQRNHCGAKARRIDGRIPNQLGLNRDEELVQPWTRDEFARKHRTHVSDIARVAPLDLRQGLRIQT